MIAAQLHSIVDIFDGSRALLERTNGVEKIRHEKAIDDKPCAVGGENGRFAHFAPIVKAGLYYGRVSDHGLHDFHEFHKRDRIEKMKSQKSRRALRCRHHFRDRKGGSIAGKNSFGFSDLVELREKLPLSIKVLDDRFDHKVAVGKIIQPGGEL